MSNTNNNLQTKTLNALHNAIMEAGGKDHPPMLAPGNYNPPYKFKWTEKTISVAEGSSETTTEGYIENYKNVSQDIRNQLDVEAEVFGTFTSRDGESLESYYSRFYKMMDELFRNQCDVTNHQVNVQFLLHYNQNGKVNEIKAERLARTANPLALVAQQKPVYYPQNHPNHYTQNSSTRSQQAATRNRDKSIVNSHLPTYDKEPTMVAVDVEMSKEKEIDKLMALISLSFKKVYKPTNNNLRTSSNTSRAHQDNTLRINRGTRYDNQRVITGARENVAYHKEKMLLCKQEEVGIQLISEQADWRDDTDDEPEDQELDAHYLYMAQIQEVTPDVADNSGPIFDTEPLQNVQNDDDNYNVFANEREHHEQQLKCKINDSKNRNKFLESSNKTLVDKLKDLKKFLAELDRYHNVNYASKVEIDCAKAKGDLMSYKMESQKSLNEHTRKINDLNQMISEMKKELFARQETISIMSQEKEAQNKFYKTREDKEIEKDIALENKVKVLDDIVYKTGQSVQIMNMLNRNCKTSFVKPEFLKKAQRANPRLYDIGCYNDNLALMLAPESDKTIRLAQESRSKLRLNIQLLYLLVLWNLSKNVNQSVATPLKKTVAVESTNQKPRNKIRKQYEHVSKTCSWWYPKFTPSGYKWKPKSPIGNVNTNVSMPLGNASRTANILEHMTPRRSTLSNTPSSSNSFAARKDNSIHRRLWVLKAHDGKSQAPKVAFRKSRCYIRDLKGNDLLTGSHGSDLYFITLQDTFTPNPICLIAKASSSQAWLWHHRLSQLNFDTINLLLKYDIVTVLPKFKFVKDHLCSSFELGKAKRKSFKTKTTPSSKRRLQILHMDLCGLMRVESFNSKKYVLVIVDDYSRYTWTHFLRSKDETPEVLIDFLKLVQRGLHAHIRTVRTNKGTKFLNKTLHAYFAQEGIEHQMSTAQTPEQNDIVERQNHTLVEAARTMLSATKVPLFFWAEAIGTICFTQNHSLVIPRHEKNTLSHLQWPKTVWYSTQSRAYRVYNKRTKVIVEAIHVNFDELPYMASNHVNEIVTTSNELDLLFSPMFDELLNGTTQVVSKSFTVNAADAPDKRQQQNITSSTSTTVAAAIPPLNIQTTPETTNQAPTVTSTKNINQAETQKENAQVEEDEFINIFSIPVQERGETSSRHVDSSNMHTFYQRHPSEHRWTKDHPLEQVIENPSQSIRTRRQLKTDGEMCMFALTVSRTEPKNIKEAMADSAWIEAMQEELHQFD
ncbi:retrovirus-related pol polyprotein from transposon TNT 1-94 [Tanacetum coccineum]|uniref:Retrovirus-related pol polyprotein from transposon TNT 1-94 n=1 Tax=Tanacetum coccineum TaxID=301880 RepID=A0ABQ5H7B5_9ASTR